MWKVPRGDLRRPQILDIAETEVRQFHAQSLRFEVVSESLAQFRDSRGKALTIDQQFVRQGLRRVGIIEYHVRTAGAGSR